MKEVPQRRHPVVIDLCSGFQSWKPVAARLGMRYVAVDVLGDRNKTKGCKGMGEPRGSRAATVVKEDGVGYGV